MSRAATLAAPIAKVVWKEGGKNYIFVQQGELAIIRRSKVSNLPDQGPKTALIKETVYGPYVRVSYWPFLGYGFWVGEGEIRQIVELTYWSRLVSFCMKLFRIRDKKLTPK